MKRDRSGTLAQEFRGLAQTLRHAPILKNFSFFWDALRRPYGAVLRLLCRNRGMPIRVGSYPLRLDPMFANLSWEKVEADAYRAFEGLVCAGDVVFDVGAHIGTYTLIALAKGGDKARVVSYEPSAQTRSLLVKHLEWNGVADRVIVRPLCCGEKPGSVTFYFNPLLPEGTNSIFPFQGASKTIVDVVSISEEVQSLGVAPDLIKIDVEGAEMGVLKGAEKILLSKKPKLVVSLHPKQLADQGLSAEMIVAWLTNLGYQPKIVASDHELHLTAQHPEFCKS